jgi:DDE superfamily endonuclease
MVPTSTFIAILHSSTGFPVILEMSNRILPILTHLNNCAVAAHRILELDRHVKMKNNPPVLQQRLCWHRFVNEKQGLRNFHRHLRMSINSFNKLLSFILAGLDDEEQRASGRGGPIIPELRLYCTLRYLAGGSYLDIHYFCGISETSFYSSVWRVIELLNASPMLNIHFPQTVQECEFAAEGFRSVSSGDAIVNCVSVVDGLLVHISTPSKKEAKNVRSFFSGHYQSYGMNIQAACDHQCRFTFLGVAGPGVMSDREAIGQVPLHRMIEELPERYCVIGDCAYRPTEHLVPIFGGASALDRNNDNWNFYASQCRIRIEMAFGMMKQKWGILTKPLRIRLRNVKRPIICWHDYTTSLSTSGCN